MQNEEGLHNRHRRARRERLEHERDSALMSFRELYRRKNTRLSSPKSRETFKSEMLVIHFMHLLGSYQHLIEPEPPAHIQVCWSNRLLAPSVDAV